MVYRQGMLTFFKELRLNNDREWFKANKSRYEAEVVEPTLILIEVMGPLLSSISPHLRADPRRSGGSMFRIYRDTRFSKNKTPYKTQVAVRFMHLKAKEVNAPGLYYSANDEGLTIGCGVWRPERQALAGIRQKIANRPKSWEAVRDDEAFNALFKWGGESLKRPPRGFEKDHPLIEDLKRKDFVGFAKFGPEQALSPDLPQLLMEHYRATVPLMKFLCSAVALEF